MTSSVEQLEEEHAEVYRELVGVIDELMQATVQRQIDPETIGLRYDEAVAEFKDIDLGTLHGEKIDGKETLEAQVEFLEEMVALRLKVLEQHLMTYPVLRAIHSGDGGQDEIYERRLLDSVNERDANYVGLEGQLHEKVVAEKALEAAQRTNLPALAATRQKVGRYLDLQHQIAELKEEPDADSRLGKLQRKYASLVRKDQIMAQLNTNLVSSLSQSNVGSDQTLREIVMDCGDYSGYGELQ